MNILTKTMDQNPMKSLHEDNIHENKLSSYIWTFVAWGLKLRSMLCVALTSSKTMMASNGLNTSRPPTLLPWVGAPPQTMLFPQGARCNSCLPRSRAADPCQPMELFRQANSMLPWEAGAPHTLDTMKPPPPTALGLLCPWDPRLCPWGAYIVLSPWAVWVCVCNNLLSTLSARFCVMHLLILLTPG